jgi:REP element-mobilizing transposase RayT
MAIWVFRGKRKTSLTVNPSKFTEKEEISEKRPKLNHTAWECTDHFVWIPNYLWKKLNGKLRQHIGALINGLAMQKGSMVVEGHLMVDHVHILVSIPPKY